MPVKACPIDEIIPALKEALRKCPSVVLHAPPGAGKTTRVPLALLDALMPGSRIIMLEPRRIAAVSAARWMAHLLGEEIGQTVGYTIRFDNRVSAATKIEVVTEGILTRRIQADPGLEGIAIIIFDEFHERSLNADLALSLSLDARRCLREDLKIIVMSATLDCAPVAGLLGDAPVITSGGRAFPVSEKYSEDRNNIPLSVKVRDAVKTALNEDEGDILVFLPGSGDIRACAAELRPEIEKKESSVTLHPLYGDLPFEEQERAILPAQQRKIVLATNIAETSLTIEGVRIVIDSGLARRLQYDPATGMNRLITVSASRSSAEQRKGRAGRLSPGVCYRLYSQHTFNSMLPFSPPEILISDLSSLALELAAWGVTGPSGLSWLDAPPQASWAAAKELLTELGAIDLSGSITERGRAMVRMPLHPRLASLLLRASDLGCPALGADLAALLSERDVVQRGEHGRMVYSREADIADRLGMLHSWRKEKKDSSGADSGALRNADRTSSQLLRLMPKSGTKDKPVKDKYELISRLLLCAYPDRIAKKRVDGEGRFVLSQGKGVRFTSTNTLSNSPYIVAAQLDAGGPGEGTVHIASPLDEETIREECADRIRTTRRVEWDRREGRIVATIEEKIGSILLSTKPFRPSDDEASPILCDAIRTSVATLTFTKEALQFQGRVALMAKHFPAESWPDLSAEALLKKTNKWLQPWLGPARTAQDIAKLDILPALRAMLTREQQRLLDDRSPTHIVVPSGSRVVLDYESGDIPVLGVKLQEMFGLADTPKIAGGRVKILLHLLSPSRKPLQITQDLKGFWDSSYHQVKKEMKGRYPKHPWPDDPWNAIPTRKVKKRM